MSDSKRVEVVYDRDCPICDYYCQRIDVDQAAGDLVRINAREDSDILQEVTGLGLDIDAGMVVRADGKIYYGSDAIHILANLSSRKGFVNRLAYSVFRWPRVAHFLYPVLAACRNLLLKLLGRSRINNLDIEDNDRF